MSSWVSLDAAMFSVGGSILAAAIVAFLRKWHWFGHLAGALVSVGLIISGVSGFFTPSEQLSVFQGPFLFATVAFRMNAYAGFFMLLIGVVGFFVSLYGIGYVSEYVGRKSVSLLLAGVLLFLATMAAVVISANVFTFLVSWECMSIVSYLLVMYEHDRKENQSAGFIYVVMTHLGTAFLTIAFLILAHFSGTYSFQDMNVTHLSDTLKTLVFVFVLIGFGTKAGLAPLHIWLPRAHPVAPSHVSALMSGVMLKMAMYGFILVVFQILNGGPPVWWGLLVSFLGAASALVGVIQALVQSDQKRMLAYSSMENMGLIFMGLGVSLILLSVHAKDLAAFALFATLAHAFNHAVFKSLLFLATGAVVASTHTKNMDLLGGLIRVLPWTAAFSLIGALSISALPPFNGFVSEWLLFQSFFALSLINDFAWMHVFGLLVITVLTMVGALTAMGFVRFFGFTFLALPRSERAQTAHEAGVFMRIGMGGLALVCMFMGVFPEVWLRLLKNSVWAIVRGRLPLAPWNLSFADIRSVHAHVSVLGVLLGGIAVSLLTLWILRMAGSSRRAVIRDTWACGETLTPRMTYTASGYSKPIRIALQRLLQPTRSLDQTGASHYFPAKYVYVSKTSAMAETYLYRPAVNMVVRIASLVRVIQNGQVQSYLAYMFVTLIIILLLVK